MELRCTGYSTQRCLDDAVRFNVDFVLMVHPSGGEEIAESLKAFEIMMGNKINLVKADGNKSRCFYCCTLHDEGEKLCTQCGAPL